MHFADSMPGGGDQPGASERRGYMRHAPNSLSYVHLDESNGGILINLSEGGLAVQAAMSVMEDELPRVRLQMPLSTTWLEASARVVWTSDSRRTLGIEFLNLADNHRAQLREWMTSEAKTGAPSSAAVVAPSESELGIPREREIPLKTVRPVRPRVHNAQAKEFDVAALLTSQETSGAALPKPVRRTVEQVSPLPLVTKPAPAVAAEAESAPSKAPGRYALLVVILAILSLAAGWEAGRGNILQTITALFLPSSVAPKGSVGSSAAPRGAVTSAPLDFEVVDGNNQAWLVPFAGPTSGVAAGPALPSVPARNLSSADEGGATSSHSYQLWTLAAPQSARSRSIQTAAAPVLPATQNGVIPSTLGPTDPNFNLVPPSQEPQRSSTLTQPEVIQRVEPIYPTDAYHERVSGTVKLEARITETGAVTDVRVMSGSPMLVPAAITALRQWRYKPEMLDGHAVASDIVVTIQFDLPH